MALKLAPKMAPKMAKVQRIRKNLTPAERERHRQPAAQVQADKPRIMEIGREVRREHERMLREVMSQLQEAKQESGLSLAELRDKTGIDRSTLSKLLNDPSSNPTLMTLNRIAQACGKRLVVNVE